MSEKKVRDILSEADVRRFLARPHYIVGQPYLWVMAFGWAIVGYYLGHRGEMQIRVAHANFFRNAGVDYGKIAAGEVGENCEWRYVGQTLLNEPAIQRADEFWGQVPRARIN